ncbi:helix-turn-helix domain-containing protein [Lentzea aerocolonigenes]|uniref:helix-turn-helix domain-containing protein n=1 Tax=Lentzea aerocolonigenes TaxID=68170 RepID=UPI0009E38959|nr:helix-turn-helix transcriptional regulator [Lentzea aerocolonigenes]
MPKRFSSVVGRSFGDGVRDAIQAAGMTQRRLAERLDWEEAKLSDVVRGKGGVTEVEVALLLGLCGVTPDETRRLLTLYRETREKGFLQFNDEDGVPNQLRTLIAQEQVATKIFVWAMNLVPGLLQIPPYSFEVVQAVPTIDPEQVVEIVAARESRRSIFHRSREFTFYVHEQALRFQVGSRELMIAQLQDLLRMSIRPYISVRVIPLSIGVHAGLAGSFTKLGFEKFEPVVFVETHNLNLFLEDKGSIAVYDEVLKALDAQALDEEQSKELITSLLT